MLGVNERMGLKLFGRKIIFEEFKPICTRYLNVTDGRTKNTVALPRSALASRGKNLPVYVLCVRKERPKHMALRGGEPEGRTTLDGNQEGRQKLG